jgi:hypothetical protein
MLVERTADPSTALGMTKGRVELPSRSMLVERTADPSTALGMTKGRVELPSRSMLVERTAGICGFPFPHYD